MSTKREDDGATQRVAAALAGADDRLARELARNEQNLRTLIDHTHVGLLVHRFGPIVYANPALVSVLGYREAGELVGRAFSTIFHGNDLGGRFATAATPEAVVVRLAQRDPQSETAWAEVRAVAIDYDGAPAILLLLRDLGGEWRARARIREREGRIWSLFTVSPMSLWEGDFSAALAYLATRERDAPLSDDELDRAIGALRFLAINEATLALFDARDPEQLLRTMPAPFGDSRREVFRALFAAMLARQMSFETELEIRTTNGAARHVALRLNVVPGHEERWSRVAISMFDLTMRRQHEAHVEDALREKEVMLREINHRIKNNLQVISSLLSLQSQHVDDPAVRTAFAQSQGRVHAIALVHDQLYRSKNLARVDLAAYVHQLVENLVRTRDATNARIEARFATTAVELPVDLAIPCGLLVNELASNAIRHAFRGRDRGTITVSLSRDGDRVSLGVRDDGIGLPAEIDPERTSTLGLGLVMTFAEQLEATVELRREHGTAFTFVFALPERTR